VRPNPFDYAEGEAFLEKPATLHVRMQEEAKAVFERVVLPSEVAPAPSHYLFRTWPDQASISSSFRVLAAISENRSLFLLVS
jgi:hypothetical protein